MKIYEAPCKVNLSLKVLGKREDGFHAVETVMVPLTLCDRLIFEKSQKGMELFCDMPGVPLDESNLVLKAARLMEKRLGKSLSWKITLEKHVPHGAGLGGGSSDAAICLVALNELEKAGLSQEELVLLSAELGSDVGFFVYRTPCVCSGRGEIVTPLQNWVSQDCWIVLLKPEFGVSTPKAYSRWKDSRELDGVDYLPQQFGAWVLENDLERPVFEMHLFLAEVKNWLKQRPETLCALMSGSGSTSFALCATEADAQAVLETAKQELDPTLWGWVGKIQA